MNFSQKIAKSRLFRNSIAFVCVIVSICCLFLVIISMLRIPDFPLEKRAIGYNRFVKVKVSEDEILGKFGEMMVGMLPEDLSFTLFVPSKKAFERDLQLRVNASLMVEKMNDTYAIVSRILGFSAVPWEIFSVMIPFKKELCFDSLSGFRLYISMDLDRRLVVNGVRSLGVEFRRKKIVIHIMDGVIMDAEFEQSFQQYNEED